MGDTRPWPAKTTTSAVGIIARLFRNGLEVEAMDPPVVGIGLVAVDGLQVHHG